MQLLRHSSAPAQAPSEGRRPRAVVEPVLTRRDDRAFRELPYELYRDDPFWVAPLRASERQRWSPRHNSSLLDRWVLRLLARRKGHVVGRIAAIVDPTFAERWRPGAGLFGFFECEPDPETAIALFEAAGSALIQRDASEMIGPVNLTTHDEVGLLVDGFDRRPAVLSPYNPRHYAALLEASGCSPLRDYHAFEWREDMKATPAVERVMRSVAARAGVFATVRLRSADPRRWNEEVAALHRVYNASFSDVWGFVPITLAEFAERAESFRPFYRPELVRIAETDEGVVGFGVLLPDISEVLHGMHGRLFPWGWLRLMRGVKRIRSGRCILLGVVPEFAGRGLAAVIAREWVQFAGLIPLTTAELSLVAAENVRMQRVIEAFGCRRIRTVRLYSRRLQGEGVRAAVPVLGYASDRSELRWERPSTRSSTVARKAAVSTCFGSISV